MYVDVQGGKGESWTPLSGGLNKVYPKPTTYIQHVQLTLLTNSIFRTAFSCFSSKFVTLLTNLTNEQARKQMKTKILVEFKPNCVNSSVFTISKYIAFFNYTAKHFLQLLIMNY